MRGTGEDRPGQGAPETGRPPRPRDRPRPGAGRVTRRRREKQSGGTSRPRP